jgi:hypothetical protein
MVPGLVDKKMVETILKIGREKMQEKQEDAVDDEIEHSL